MSNLETPDISNPLPFQFRFQKSIPTYRRSVVNRRHQTAQGQSKAKPGLPLLNILVEILNMTLMSPKVASSIQYLTGMSKGGNIQESAHLKIFYIEKNT